MPVTRGCEPEPRDRKRHMSLSNGNDVSALFPPFCLSLAIRARPPAALPRVYERTPETRARITGVAGRRFLAQKRKFARP